MDRNLICGSNRTIDIMSLSARRAWIEMDWASVITAMTSQVALRKESVDRNSINLAIEIGITTSLSARRAWIEIHFMPSIGTLRSTVALRKESVDRNCKINTRGSEKMKSLSARRAWIEMSRLT